MESYLSETVERHARASAAKGTQVLLEHFSTGQVRADPNRLSQVMDNLISNAVKYSPPGSVVRVQVEHGQEGWRFAVSDQGPGISEGEQKKLFQNFSRLSSRPTGGEKSTGLGLAITRRLVEAHGGKIGVISASGAGTTFWFTIPDKNT